MFCFLCLLHLCLTSSSSLCLSSAAAPLICLFCSSLSGATLKLLFVLFLLQIWVHSAHNGSGYYSGYGEEVLQSDHFNSRLSFGDTQTVWARTGYLGFLRRTELTDANGGKCPTSPRDHVTQVLTNGVNMASVFPNQRDTTPCSWWELWRRPWS